MPPSEDGRSRLPMNFRKLDILAASIELGGGRSCGYPGEDRQ